MPIRLPKSIVDKAGSIYSLDSKISSSLWVLRVLAPGKKRLVGHANCITEGKVLRLMDIEIDDGFRRQGLGSSLLKAIVEASRFHHKLITGVIKTGDLAEYPDLPAWYEQNGFDVNRSATSITFQKIV